MWEYVRTETSDYGEFKDQVREEFKQGKLVRRYLYVDNQDIWFESKLYEMEIEGRTDIITRYHCDDDSIEVYPY